MPMVSTLSKLGTVCINFVSLYTTFLNWEILPEPKKVLSTSVDSCLRYVAKSDIF